MEGKIEGIEQVNRVLENILKGMLGKAVRVIDVNARLLQK